MKNLKKMLSVVSVAAMILGLTGCAAESDGSDGDVVHLTIWSPTDEQAIEEWWAEKLTEWNEAHPDIQVSREAIDRSDSYAYENKIITATTSHDLPDILYVDGPTVSYYAANELLIPIDDCYAEEDLEDFMPSTIQQCTYDDSLYAMAATESSVALYYNKDYLDAAGIEYPSDTNIEDAWTWSEFYEYAEKLTTDDYVGTNLIMDKGEGLIYALGSLWQENNAPMLSEDGSEADGYVNSTASVETAEYVNNFIQNGYANIDPIEDEFQNGYAATMLGGSWEIASLEESDLNWGISYFPISDSGEAVSPTGDWSAGITKDCENVKAAKEFMVWLMNSENVATYASAIAKPAARTSSYEYMEGWDEGARSLILWQLQNTGVARPSSPSYSILSSEFATALLNIFSGADIQSEFDKVADEFDDDYTTFYGD